ncbi:MAG: hypothetical protein DHS20C15_03990 [Planctomycetota bacterium]|nr:MAG: hypothetical protein DHS20C15_03990 [Planctomycetota bacterium]
MRALPAGKSDESTDAQESTAPRDAAAAPESSAAQASPASGEDPETESKKKRKESKPPLRLDVIRRGLGDLALRSPRDTGVLVMNGLLALQAGDRAAAVRWLDDALDLEPAHVTAVVTRAGLSVRDGNLDHARRLLEEAATLRPDEPALFDGLAGVAFFGGELEEAESHLARAAALDESPDAVRAYHRGLLAERRGGDAVARAHFERALQLQPGHANAARHLRALAAGLQP